MPARCPNNSPDGSCTRSQIRLRRKSKSIASAIRRPGPQDKDHSSGDGETARTQSKGDAIKESWSSPMTAVPVPVPEYSPRPAVDTASSSQSTSASVTMVESSSTSMAQTTTHRTLLPFLSVPPSMTGLGFTGTQLAPSSRASDPPKATTERATTKPLGTRHLSIPIIIALAIGSAVLFLVFVVVIKSRLRPRRRIHPTPSRPILDDTPSDDDLKVDGSPLFGCDGRQSLPGANGLCSWTQYVPPALRPTSAAEPADVKSQNCNDEKAETPTRNDSGSGDQITHPLRAHGSGHPITPANSLQRVPSALTRLTNRLSDASMSLYVNHITRDSQIDKHTPLTADGHPAIERSSCNAPRSVDDTNVHRGDKHHRSSRGHVYDGADVLTPKIESPPRAVAKATLAPPAITKGGRSRIKSTYYTVGYPRVSAAAPSVASQVSIPGANLVASQRAVRKSESQRVRDTHALTLALGIECSELSPLSSPRLTLYPDDSLSVVGDAQTQTHQLHGDAHSRDRSGKEKNPSMFRNSQTGMLLPHGDTTTALGNLMLLDYSSKSLASIATRDTVVPSSMPPVPSLRNIKTYLAGDKPPRVPSPPTLPSLAQMALAHEHSESFANYRSPTYSIYGLYENERKSRAGLHDIRGLC